MLFFFYIVFTLILLRFGEFAKYKRGASEVTWCKVSFCVCFLFSFPTAKTVILFLWENLMLFAFLKWTFHSPLVKNVFC